MRYLSILALLGAVSSCAPNRPFPAEYTPKAYSTCSGRTSHNIDVNESTVAKTLSRNAMATTLSTTSVFSVADDQAMQMIHALPQGLNGTDCTSAVNATNKTSTTLLLDCQKCHAVVFVHANATFSGSAPRPMTTSNETNQDLEVLKGVLRDFFVAQKLAIYIVGGVVGTLQIIDFIFKFAGHVRSIREQWKLLRV